jgi:hypothetical protein
MKGRMMARRAGSRGAVFALLVAVLAVLVHARSSLLVRAEAPGTGGMRAVKTYIAGETWFVSEGLLIVAGLAIC